MSIMEAHDIPYAATVSVAHPEDFVKKVRKAKDIRGFRFIHAFSPCPPGWRMNPMKTIEVARLVVDTNMFPLYEIEGGRLRITKKGKGLPIGDYLSIQGRFAHLTEDEVRSIQDTVDAAMRALEERAARDSG
jgi:pyruvate/2-oxoacid:ferredoxin oxidoreductase beta subunit